MYSRVSFSCGCNAPMEQHPSCTNHECRALFPYCSMLINQRYVRLGGLLRLRRTRKSVRAINAAFADTRRRKPRRTPIPSSVIPSGVCMARMPIPAGQVQVIWPFSPAWGPGVVSCSPFPGSWACTAPREQAIPNTRSVINHMRGRITGFIVTLLPAASGQRAPLLRPLRDAVEESVLEGLA